MNTKPSFRIACQILSVLVLAVGIVYLFPRQQSAFKYYFQLGQPWGYDLLTAQFDFAIYKSEEALAVEQQQVLQDFKPYYTVESDTFPLQYYVVSVREMQRIKDLGCKQIAVLHNHEARPLSVNALYTPRSVYQVTGINIDPNLVYDTISSERLKQTMLSSVSLTQGMVQAGEKIIDTGEVVGEKQYQMLVSLRRAMEEKNISQRQSLIAHIGTCLLVLLLLMQFVIYLFTFRRDLLNQLNNTFFFTILMAIIIASSLLVIRFAPANCIYLVPFAWGPIITRVFFDSRTALFMHIITVLIVSLAAPSPYVFIVMQITVGMVAVASLRDVTQRAQLARSAAYTFLMYCVSYTAMVMVMTGDFNDIDYVNFIYFFINAVLVICSYGVIYLFERTFGLISNVTLVELTNVNSNLMLAFAEKAPGTFQHSLQVSNLATEAAKRITANALLVRTGALYHDIGKMLHPEHFTENQVPGFNPLLDMSCQQAAKAVVAHVADGVTMARKNHLPESIIHFIQSHHGTSVVRYFYNTAVNETQAARAAGQDVPDVNITDFTYPGPRPATKEAAILMMADAVEARARSLSVLNVDTISQMVDQMIDSQVSAGQFAETNLSFRDLEIVRQVFKQKLLEIHHHRISYPEINK